MAEYHNAKTDYILKIDGVYESTLDVEGFAQMMKDPSYCYKFYWLEAIVNLIAQDVAETMLFIEKVKIQSFLILQVLSATEKRVLKTSNDILQPNFHSLALYLVLSVANATIRKTRLSIKLYYV